MSNLQKDESLSNVKASYKIETGARLTTVEAHFITATPGEKEKKEAEPVSQPEVAEEEVEQGLSKRSKQITKAEKKKLKDAARKKAGEALVNAKLKEKKPKKKVKFNL
eukprot:TRINITY_DN15785_c0_g1_i1.p1 TRINITY_DN15785_c0_g1~~TRINITY_DN15785_c0_g1_i1.p1  ORF type:complete len:108 (-),score=54.88 TRINITY_DN15785_c0_g1_i1:31-354(-)